MKGQERRHRFVVGQWVRGQLFYGRTRLIQEFVDGDRDWLWLLGTRRMGKTSLLRQLEWLTSDGSQGYFPVLWDFQGADSPQELATNLLDALLDAEERLGERGIDVRELGDDDLFETLGRLRRRLRSNHLKLLLLCDEVEELLGLSRSHPALLRKLRHALQAQEGVRSVLSSSVRLWSLSERDEDTSPFLHGFVPPSYLSGLTDSDARALIGQEQLPAQLRPRFRQDSVERILGHCGNHPYLIQLLCKRYWELGDLEEACRQVRADEMVARMFAVDFEMQSQDDRAILRRIAASGPVAPAELARSLDLSDDALERRLQLLVNLGFVRARKQGEITLASVFFGRWLADGTEGTGVDAPVPSGRTVVRVGGWEVRPELNVIVRDGAEVQLEPKVMDLLRFLVQNSNRVVSKEEIIDGVWEGRAISNSALTRAMSELRRALGDDAREARFIETISKRGYRLIAPLER